MDLHWCKQPEVGLPKPDAVLYLTLPVEVAASRMAFGGERYENLKTQTEVATVYRKLISSEWKVCM